MMASKTPTLPKGHRNTIKERQEDDRSKKEFVRNLQEKYERACKAAKKYPLKCVIEQFQNSDFDLSGKKIGCKQMKAVLTSLLSNDRMTSINLRDNNLGDDGVFLVSDFLRHNIYITHINLAENGICVPGLKAITSTIMDNILITQVDLSDNELSDNGAKVIAELIEVKTGLIELSLHHNSIGETGAVAIGKALAHNGTIERLDLSWNHIRGQGAIAISHSLKTNNCLRSLNVAWNGFGKEGAKALGEALPENTRLVELDVTNNRIEANGMALFMMGLRNNNTLQTLKLGKNPISSEVARHLLMIIESNKNSAIMRLELSDISVDEDFAAVLERLSAGKHFSVSHGRIVRKVPEKPPQLPKVPPRDPLEQMFDFKYEHGYRTLDLLMRMDKDNNFVIDREEFKNGLLEMGIEAADDDIDDLMGRLDSNSDGCIDYSEFVQGEKEYGSRHKRHINMQTVQKIKSLAIAMMKLKVKEQTDTTKRHARCHVDAGFASIKKLYRRTDCETIGQLEEVINRSCMANLAVRYPQWQWRNWKVFLGATFKPLKNIRKYHYFRFSSEEQGVVIVRRHRYTEEERINILKEPGFRYNSVARPEVLTPPDLSQARQTYLYSQVRPYVRPALQDEFCEVP